LKTTLKDETYFVQQASLRSLDRLMGKDKVADLCAIVRDSFPSFTHDVAQAEALSILARYSCGAARDIFRKVVTEQLSCYPVVQAIQGIVKIRDVEALELLQAKQAVNEALEVRNEVVTAYAELGGILSIQAIAPFLKDKAYTVRRNAAGQLGRFASLRAAPHLLEAMEDPECPELRRIAWESLKKISNMDMNFRYSDPPEDRKKDLVPWHGWWERMKKKNME
jgi:HEAT repeat protein